MFLSANFTDNSIHRHIHIWSPGCKDFCHELRQRNFTKKWLWPWKILFNKCLCLLLFIFFFIFYHTQHFYTNFLPVFLDKPRPVFHTCFLFQGMDQPSSFCPQMSVSCPLPLSTGPWHLKLLSKAQNPHSVKWVKKNKWDYGSNSTAMAPHCLTNTQKIWDRKLVVSKILRYRKPRQIG